MQLAEDEDRETEDDLDEEDEEYDSGGSGVAMTPPGGQLLNILNPIITISYSSDSPGAGRRHLAKKNSVVEGLIDPERDIYAIPSQVLIMIWRLCSNKFPRVWASPTTMKFTSSPSLTSLHTTESKR